MHGFPKSRILLLMGEVTRILSEAEAGRAGAAEELLPLVYAELRRLAARKMMEESPGQTLEATALVHEAYVRLVDQPKDRKQDWNSRGHFFGAAAEAMRRILIEKARHKKSAKAGGEFQRHDLSDIQPAMGGKNLDLLALNEALDQLEKRDQRQAALVKLRFFAGMTIAEAAAALGVSTGTAENDWTYARCWLRVQMGEGVDDQHS